MTKVLVTEGSLSDIGDAIRSKLGGSTTYKPSEMAAAITSITGVTSADNGKVVVNGALVAQTSTTVTQNGTVDTTTNNEVVVNVSGGGGGGMSTISRADWNALTTAQKQAYGLVGIIDYTTGFERGVLVNGADYSVIQEFLPQTSDQHVKTFATYDSFEAGSTEWGDGDSPITASKALARYQSEDAVYFDAKTSSNVIGVPLGGTNTDFTMYVVAKGLSYVSGDVIVMGSVNSWSNSNLVMLYHRNGTVWRSSIYGSDADLTDTNGSYVAVAIRSDSMKASWFAHDGANRKNVSYSNHGTSFTFGSRNGNVFSTDLAVKFVGYVDEAETDDQITANLANLATVFGLS